jgi:hypothetical protein
MYETETGRDYRFASGKEWAQSVNGGNKNGKSDQYF